MSDSRARRLLSGPLPWILGAVALVAVAAWQWVEREPTPSDPRPMGGVEDVLALAERPDVNVLFVLVDTLRADRIHAYGYPRETSPFYDALAYHGVRFARHLGQSSWTKSSMASLWTGLYPQRAGVTRFDDVLTEEATLAAEVFRDAGFRTAGLWRNGWVAENFGFDQGFEVYTRPVPRGVPPELRRSNPTISFRGTDLDLVESAREFLRLHGRERWFLYLHMMDVHEYTYSKESAKFGSTYSDLYDNTILHTTHILDQLSAVRNDLDLLPHTVIVLAPDHGVYFA
jgi:membrane-anchored protein YejM (alkaline phosphatase superfamily)